MKHLLQKMLGNLYLHYKEFNTALIRIEGRLNFKPIIPMSSNPNDALSLTRDHYLKGDALWLIPDPTFLTIPID